MMVVMHHNMTFPNIMVYDTRTLGVTCSIMHNVRKMVLVIQRVVGGDEFYMSAEDALPNI